MAIKTDFSDAEWKMMQRGVTGAGTLVSLADQDFSDSFGEAGALAKYLGTQRTVGSTELMREMATAHGRGLALSRARPRSGPGGRRGEKRCEAD